MVQQFEFRRTEKKEAVGFGGLAQKEEDDERRGRAVVGQMR